MTFATSLRSRRAFLALIAAVAVAVALATGLSGAGDDASARPAHSHASHDVRAVQNAKQASFHDDMRKLWEDHVTWTRLAIVTFSDGSPGVDATAARLMRNQEDIGEAIKPFYGTAAGDQLTALLKDHIGIAVQLLQAAKAGDQSGFDTANAAWYANSDEIADFLAGANPKYWPRATMRASMRMHLDQTLAEAGHELGGEYAASVADYEEIHHHILEMADLLSAGIIRAFPSSFH